MDECVDRKLHRAVGMSDMAALLAVGFAFPTADLAAALGNGAFMADWRASMADALGVADDAAFDEQTRVLHERCDDVFSAEDASEASLRREYSRMFLAPGAVVPVWPYESCFRHRALKIDGTPSVFNTRTANDVQRRMHEAGIRTVDENTEPCDSVFHELEFLSYLHACYGEALRVEDGEAADLALQRLMELYETHVVLWIPAFMDAVIEKSRIPAYCALAELGRAYLEQLKADIEALSATADAAEGR